MNDNLPSCQSSRRAMRGGHILRNGLGVNLDSGSFILPSPKRRFEIIPRGPDLHSRRLHLLRHFLIPKCSEIRHVPTKFEIGDALFPTVGPIGGVDILER